MNRAGIVGMGLWIPTEVRRNSAWPESFIRAFHQQRDGRRTQDMTNIDRESTDRPHDGLVRKYAALYDDDPFKGTTRRHVADPAVPTVEGDAKASRAALADAGVDARDIDVVCSSAIVQDALAPSNGPAIQHLVGCTRAPGIGVEAYCSSALAQFDIAAGLVESGRARFVLCVQSHQIARINDLALPTSPIFGDGSAAFVVGQVPDGRGLQHMVRGGDGSLRKAVIHEYRETPGATWWRDAAGPIVPGIGDLDALKRMTKNALAYPIETIQELCAAAKVATASLAALAMIQPVVWYQAALAEGLGMPAERVPSTYAEYAHLGGAGVVANLLEARRRGLLERGANVVLYAHGAGMTRYGALLKW